MGHHSRSSERTQYTVNLEPVHCGFTLAAAKWDWRKLVKALLNATEPPGWIAPAEAEALAEAIVAATGQDVVDFVVV